MIDNGSKNVCYFPWKNQIQTRSAKWAALRALPAEDRIRLEERFWSKVDRSSEGCWLWQGSTARGYGQFVARLDGRFYNFSAHGVAWTLTNGLIPDGLGLCHNCPTGDDPRCCRPDHLFLGTQAQNLDDARDKGRLVDGLHARKLSDDAYREILTRPYRRGSGLELAQKYGVSKVSISRIRHGHQGLLYQRNQLSPIRLERVPFVFLSVRGEVA